MSIKDYAISVFDSLTEEQLLDFIKHFADDNILALVESEIIANNPDRKHYSNFSEILEEIENEEMEIIKYPSEESVTNAIDADEPFLAIISFDGKKAVMCQIEEAMEHHILLMKVGYKSTDIDKFFRIVFDKSGADWTFVCPSDYKNIPYKDKRIKTFYKVGYIVGINIPKRYSRHFNIMNED